MKQLSYWASRHIVATRWLVAGCHLVANIMGWWWAALLYAAQIHPVAGAFWSTLGIIGVAMLLHPRKWKIKAPGYTYAWHKTCDAVICAGIILLVTLTGPYLIRGQSDPAQSVISTRANALERHTVKERTSFLSRAATGVAHFFDRVKDKYQEMSTGAKVALVALTIVLTCVFCFFWVGVVCSLSCEGYGVLAFFAALFGFGGGITGCVFLCRRIINGPRRVKQTVK